MDRPRTSGAGKFRRRLTRIEIVENGGIPGVRIFQCPDFDGFSSMLYNENHLYPLRRCRYRQLDYRQYKMAFFHRTNSDSQLQWLQTGLQESGDLNSRIAAHLRLALSASLASNLSQLAFCDEDG